MPPPGGAAPGGGIGGGGRAMYGVPMRSTRLWGDIRERDYRQNIVTPDGVAVWAGITINQRTTRSFSGCSLKHDPPIFPGKR